MFSPRRWAAAALLCCLAAASPALGKVYHSVRSLLAEQFRNSSSVAYERVQLKPEVKAAIEKQLGRPLAKSKYLIYVAKRADKIDGYAVFDEERGQHELIDFATFFDAGGVVTRAEVVAYREGYGSEIRRDSFRQQFVGKGARSSFQLGQDIDAVSGATISSEAMSRAVHRAALVLDKTLLGH